MCFSPYLGFRSLCVREERGVPKGLVHNLFCSFSPWGAQNIKVIIKLFFVDIVTTQNDHAPYEKHILVRIYVFFHLFWVLGVAREGGGGSPKRWAHNLLMPFVTLGSSKIQASKLISCAIVTTQKDQARYVKYV